MIEPWPEQIRGAEEGAKILKNYALLYLAWEERTGKSLTSLLICEQILVIKVLIITKKKAKPDWDALIADATLYKSYTVMTYHMLHNLNDDDWDLIILDEAHSYIASFPKPGKIWEQVNKLTKDKPLIYLSATPHAQTPAQLYHQFALSTWSPWRQYKDYKSWHKEYGEAYSIYMHGRYIDMWDKVDDDSVLAEANHLFLARTRKQAGHIQEPTDKLHWIQLGEQTREAYNTLLKHRVMGYIHRKREYVIEYDTVAKLRAGLHMLEGGTVKYTEVKLNAKKRPVIKSQYFDLPFDEKVDYIKTNWGDRDDMAIMYHYIGEGKKLRATFKTAQVLQASTYAEGVDLSHIKHLIIYSQNWSTAQHTQRRARQANKHRKTPIIVHFLLIKNGISEEVYNCVSVNKENYVDRVFRGLTI